MKQLKRAVYPGSFNPPTTAHLAISEAVRKQRDVDEVVLVVSHKALAKEEVEHPRFEHRMSVLAELSREYSWLSAVETDQQLLADIAEGFEVLIMGADKWHQIQDPVWYNNDPEQRDLAIARLPELAIAPRPPLEVPAVHLLTVDDEHHDTSSTRARNGDLSVMLPPARNFAEQTGAWIDPTRYERWWSSQQLS